MKLLLVHPGATWSTADVWAGLAPALERAGVEVVHHALDGRIQAAAGYLKWVWQHHGRRAEKPGPGDAAYLASVGALERALGLECDAVLIVSGMHFHHAALRLLRRAGVKTAILFTESPYDDEWQLQFAPLTDACWTNERAALPRFRAVQPNTHYWQHAYDPARHTPGAQAGDAELPAHDAVFIGTGFAERVELFRAVDWTGVDFGLYGSWQLVGSRAALRRHIRGGITRNDVTAGLYRRAKVGLNLHRQSVGFGSDARRIAAADAESLGPRVYELAAAGCFFVTDYRRELADVFGDAAPTFRTPDELTAALRRWLPDAGARQAATTRLLNAVQPHTFDARVRDMLAVLGNL